MIRELQASDIPSIVAEYKILGWRNKTKALFERYLREQEPGARVVLVAVLGSEFAGYATVIWESVYSSFREQGIPEINDFNVLPQFRRRGIGSQLMDEAEARIAERSGVAGIGVGMPSDYGAAQRMYVLRGYVPDGRGLISHGSQIEYEMHVPVDDDLVLYFTKELRLVHGS